MFIEKVKNNLFPIIAVILTLFAIIPLFHSGFFPVHDDEQVGRLFELNLSLMSGQFPVRLIPDLGFGYGYLLFNFYPPFVYYLGELFRLLSFSYIDSTKLVMGSGFILSAYFMYLFVKEMYGRAAGLVSSAFYIYAPYHSVDIYVRGALPEFFSFVFIPAIFWSYLRLSKENSKKYVILASLFNFSLVITHNLVALMASVFIAAYLIFLLYESKEKIKFARNIFLTIIFAVLLSSFFIFPALLENKYTLVSLLTTQLADYNNHFVYIRQFWNSPWGYGGSVYGLNDGLSFQIGKIQIIGAFVSVILGIWLAFKKKYYLSVFLFFILFLFSVFMQTFYSKFVWDNIKSLSYIQFPWRYLLFSVFFSSILTGFLVSLIQNKHYRYFISSVLILTVIALNISYFRPKQYLSVNDNFYINSQTLKWKTSKMSFEYIPNGVALKTSTVGNSIPQIDEKNIANTPYKLLSGDMDIATNKDTSTDKVFAINVKKAGKIQINQFYYPGWVIMNQQNKQMAYSYNNKLSVIRVDVPDGTTQLHAQFQNTKLRLVSNLLSIIGIISLLVYSLLNLKKYVKN